MLGVTLGNTRGWANFAESKYSFPLGEGRNTFLWDVLYLLDTGYEGGARFQRSALSWAPNKTGWLEVRGLGMKMTRPRGSRELNPAFKAFPWSPRCLESCGVGWLFVWWRSVEGLGLSLLPSAAYSLTGFSAARRPPSSWWWERRVSAEDSRFSSTG